MKKIYLLIVILLSVSARVQAQDANTNANSTSEPLDINIGVDDIAEALFFVGGTRSNLENDNIVIVAERMFQRLRFDLGCENLSNYYQLNNESRACVFKNKKGNYTLTGFVADRSVRAANYGAIRNTNEVIGIRGERFFIFNTVIGGEIGFRENRMKYLGKTLHSEEETYIGFTISRPLEVRKKTARSFSADISAYKKMLEARELQQRFLQQLNEGSNQ